MTRRTQGYNAFNTGELDPELHARADIKQYYSSLKSAKNLIGTPQGGVRVKFGSEFRYLLRRKMVAFSVAGKTVTAPNGGTAGNAIDGSASTKLITTTPMAGVDYIVFHIDLAAPSTFQAVDLAQISCASSSGTVLKVQYSADDSAWSDLGPAKPISTTPRNLRFALQPGLFATARYWRVMIAGGPPALGTCSFGNFEIWATGTKSALKQVEINVNPSSVYTIALTEKNADVFEGGVWRGAIITPHTSDQLDEINYTQSIDTVILFHKDVQQYKLLRLGVAEHWHSEFVQFSNIPRFDFGDVVYANAVNEQQDIHFTLFGLANTSIFNLTIESYTTSDIQYNSSFATLGPRIQSALEALPNVDTGLTVTVVSGDGTGDMAVRVTFSGGTNAGRPWLPMVMRLTQPFGNERGQVERITHGMAGGEDLWSQTRGFPRHGVFFQQRLVQGGFRSRGNAIAYSRTGEFFDFDVNFDAPSGAILDLLDSDDDRTIRRFHVGKDLQIFTNTSAHYIASRTIDRNQPRDYVQAARAGIVEGSRSIDLQGATVFLEAGGEVLREFSYSAIDANYNTNNLSIISSHLITGARDLTVRRSSSAGDADLIFITKDDGTLTVVTALRAEEVMGITPLGNETGNFLSVAVDINGLIYLGRDRDILGTTELVLETASFSLYLDAGMTGTVAGANVTGLGVLEGKEVYAFFDGSPHGPFTVAGGAIAHGLDDPPTVAIVGLWAPPLGETLDMRPQDSEAAPRRKRRIFKIWASIVNTGNIAIGANGAPPREVPLWGFSEPIDVPLLDRLVTGEVNRSGISGWTYPGNIVFTQTMPGPLELRALRAEYDG